MAANGLLLSPPRHVTFSASLVLGFLGIFGYIVVLPVVSVYAFWLVVIAFILLVLATLLKDL